MRRVTYQCPACGRVSESDERCEGTPHAPHAPREVARADHLSEALDVDEPVARVAEDAADLSG